MTIQAVEFYSGIGAFAQACRNFDMDVVAAFDQSQLANLTYKNNWGHAPRQRNLDTIPSDDIPRADLWWLSPPCTPFSRRGHQKGKEDNRAKSFLHLLELLPQKAPQYVLIENVRGFKDSPMHSHLMQKLAECRYHTREIDLCSSMFGIPMLRPRVFIVASLDPLPEVLSVPLAADRKILTDFLWETDTAFICEPDMVKRYEAVLNIVDPALSGAYLICFTSGYHRCRQASGSLIDMGEGKTRFVSPAEILLLLGFDSSFMIPLEIPLPAAYRLVGNSVDVRAINFLLQNILGLR